ncbi:MAG: histidine kinase [Bacteroidota bacterium]
MFKLSNPMHRAGAQSLFWFLMTLLVVWPALMERSESIFALRSVIILVLQLILIWLNVMVLFPKLFLAQKRVTYFTVLISIIVLLGLALLPTSVEVILTIGPDQREMTPPLPVRFGSFAFPLLFTMAISITIEFFEIAQTRVRENALLAQEQLETELKFLRNQINPHFLFNALNNIYSLSMMQSEKTPDSIAQLSDILRYVIYDSERQTVPLRKEIDYIQDYINLFQLKKNGGLNIQMEVPANLQDQQVPPILFIPFIENALKHSNIEQGDTAWVKIQWEQNEKQLDFWVANSVPSTPLAKDETGGVGLKNVQRRLELLFPECHNLDINQVQEVFTVHLSLDLA